MKGILLESLPGHLGAFNYVKALAINQAIIKVGAPVLSSRIRSKEIKKYLSITIAASSKVPISEIIETALKAVSSWTTDNR